MKTHSPPDPPGVGVVHRGVQSRPEAPGQLDVEGVEVDSGSCSRQALYSACRARSSARTAAHRAGRSFARARPPLLDGETPACR